jgi:LmbE family N-acetylglucosaminyl deacetylase
MKGDNVIFLALTLGVEVHTESLVGRTVEELKRAQKVASSAAAKVLGVNECKYFDFGDVPLVSTREKLLELGEFIQDLRPDMIISAHYPFNQTQGGSDHGEAARMLERAPTSRRHDGREPYKAEAMWISSSDYVFGLSSPSDGMPTVTVDITDTMELKLEACQVAWQYAELGENFEENQRTWHANLGLNGGVKYAEIFEGSSTPTVVEHL